MAEQEHWAKVVYQPDLLDTVECSCGWKSRVYYDGREFAYVVENDVWYSAMQSITASKPPRRSITSDGDHRERMMVYSIKDSDMRDLVAALRYASDQTRKRLSPHPEVLKQADRWDDLADRFEHGATADLNAPQ